MSNALGTGDTAPATMTGGSEKETDHDNRRRGAHLAVRAISGDGEARKDRSLKSDQSEKAVLEGVFLPTAWAATGEVANVSLMAFDEKEYPIDSAVARDYGILELIRRHVRLWAVVRDGRVIEVTQVAIVNE